MSLGLLKEKFGHSAPSDEKRADSKLLKEKFSHSTIPDQRDDRKKIHERLNVMTERAPAGDMKSIKDHHRAQIEEQQKTIDTLEIATSDLAREVVLLKRENDVLKKELDQSKETKIQTVVEKIEKDSSNLIPTLTAISRQKQGNQKLSWDRWLQIPESKYLFRISETVARRVFNDSNAIVEKNANSPHFRDLDYYRNRYRTRGGDAPAKNYFLSFTGNDEHDQSGRSDSARVDIVATQFTPNDPTNKGFDEGSGRKPLAESGFTVSYWWKPIENYADSFPIGWKRDNDARFEFGIKNASKPYFSIGGSEVKNTTWASHFDNSGQGHLSGSLLDSGVGTAPGSGNNLILNEWYHVVATYAGTDNADGDGNYLRKIYLNGYHIYGGFGEAKQSVNWNDYTGAQMTQGLSFGMRAVVASGNHTDGLRHTKYNNGQACGLDEIAIYNEEKDATWVEDVYGGGTDYNHKDSGGSGLVGYWRFNEGSGMIVEDLSGYGWHGTLTNAGYGTKIDGTVGNSSTIAGINARFPNVKPTWSDMDNEERG